MKHQLAKHRHFTNNSPTAIRIQAVAEIALLQQVSLPGRTCFAHNQRIGGKDDHNGTVLFDSSIGL